MKMLKQALLACAIGFGPVELAADKGPEAEVMLFGVFHFANPGHDVVQTSQVNVMTAENQRFLDGLARRLAGFEPTVVLLEFDPGKEPAMQEKYRQFLAGNFELPSNEIYQLGFRIAKESGLQTVHAFDEREIGWNAEALFEYMPQHEPETQARMDLLVQQVTVKQQEAHAAKPFAELLLMTNDPEEDRLNKYMYLITNHVGAGVNFVGADAAASWWHRNFRMYANIQRHAVPGARVLAIAGQGHTAILKDLLAIDRDRVAVDVRPYVAER